MSSNYNLTIIFFLDDYKTAHRKCKTALDRDNLSSLSESVEYGKRFRVPKRKRKYSDIDTDTKSECSEENSLPINFLIYKADKIVFSSNSAHKYTVN